MTLSDLLDALYQDLGYEAIPSATVTKRLTRYISEGYRHILSMNEMGPLRSGTLAASSSPNRKTYGFPSAFVSIDQVVDVTNNIRLRLMTQDQFRTIDPQEVSSGTPTHYVPLGYGPTVQDPFQTTLWVASTDAADTTQVVSLSGIIHEGLLLPGVPVQTYTATLNGTTPVAIGAPDTYAVITQWRLSAPALGIVTLANSIPVTVATQVLGQIQAGQLSVQYQQLRLWPTPAGTYQYQIDGTVTIADLVMTGDIPLLPSDFQYMLTDYGRMKEFGYRDDSRYAMAQAEYQSKLKLLRERIMNPNDYRPRVGRVPDGSSNLGSFFPPGRW